MASDDNDTGEKSEEPTGRRLSQARENGQIAKSVELSQVLGMTAAYLGIQYISPYIWDDLVLIVKGGLSGAHVGEDLNISGLHFQFVGLLKTLLPELLALMVLAAIFGAGSTALQTKFLWSNKLLKPKWTNISPISGIKRIFSINNAFSVGKSLAKLAIILPIAYFAFMEIFPELLSLLRLPITDLLPYTGKTLSIFYWRIIGLLLVLAIVDYIWNWWTTKRDLKMTKVEVQEEQKAVEGDEKTRMQIRQKALQKARDRMMLDVPEADVVVTNPTHLSVALKYEMKPGSAPQVVAKGRGYVALRIREIAQEHGVPVVERKPLARALYKSVEVGQEIPLELFSAVAELLAYIYKVKGKSRDFMNKRNKQSQEQKI